VNAAFLLQHGGEERLCKEADHSGGDGSDMSCWKCGKQQPADSGQNM
jgi:hypothetical protein